ncbi:MAG: phosphoglucomutase [Planctomycetota bacterium]|nr:MAG: phosphoglucomutase [Planctomycetota bacterium]
MSRRRAATPRLSRPLYRARIRRRNEPDETGGQVRPSPTNISMDPIITDRVNRWLNDPAILPADKEEIRALINQNDERELTDRFYRDLEFGTGGIRGIIGAGPNRMNAYTVGAAAQGLANYIARQGETAKKAGIAIAFDSRRMSVDFARRVACVMARNGITAHLFEALRPTPLLSFAVRHLRCTAGVMITASHNPPEYNGLKAYWSDGAQVVPPHDEEIIGEVRAVSDYAAIRQMPEADARAAGLIRTIPREVDDAFLALVDASVLAPQVCREQGRRMKIVFTPLHGTGGTLIPQALRRRGFEHVLEEPAQSIPDGDFPTVKSPNPEEGAALKLGIDLARSESAELVIASDPDADRVGIAVRDASGEFRLLTGNQTAAILTCYICEQLKRTGRMPRHAVMLTTIVSSDLMKDIARSYGAEVIEVLTGFKWIADRVRQYELSGTSEHPSRQYIFGAEESYGYMPCTFVRDKDAVTSAAMIAEAAAFAAAQGGTLLTFLDDLFQKYGYHEEGAKSITMPGADGAARIQAMMAALRKSPPREMGGVPVRSCGDLMTGEIRATGTGCVTGRYDLPKSDVIVLTLSDGTKVIARPSGTEPKIKFYLLVKESGTDLTAARRRAGAKIAAIVAELSRLS